jgi:hypothetical protein
MKMKKITLLFSVSLFLFSCGGRKTQNENTAAISEKAAVVYTVDELYVRAADLVDQEVTVKGTVMHVCKHGGERCFLMGSTEDLNIRVEAGEKIGTFSQKQMGSDLTITGIFKEVKNEADAHNPGSGHGEENHSGDKETETAHQVIAEAEKNAPVVYFMEGLEIVKEEI